MQYKKFRVTAFFLSLLLVIPLLMPSCGDTEKPEVTQPEEIVLPDRDVCLKAGIPSGESLSFSPFENGILKDTCTVPVAAADPSGRHADSEGIPQAAESVEFLLCGEEGEEKSCVKITLKNGLMFSDGTPVTSGDVVLSLISRMCHDYYSGGIIPPVPGCLNVIKGNDEYERYYSLGKEILSHGTEYVPGEGDSFSAENSAVFQKKLNESGEKFANDIISYIEENYLDDSTVESYICRGYSTASVKESEETLCAFAMKLWGLGDFIYSYVADPEGEYIGIEDGEGGYTLKTSLAEAMENEDYIVWVPDEFGDYYYSYAKDTHLPVDENTDIASVWTYHKELNDKYTVISKSGISGFRDISGTYYSLKAGEGPCAADIFSLICFCYTENGFFNYEKAEIKEAPGPDSRFVVPALESFASSKPGKSFTGEIPGIEVSREGEKDTVTVYYTCPSGDFLSYLSETAVIFFDSDSAARVTENQNGARNYSGFCRDEKYILSLNDALKGVSSGAFSYAGERDGETYLEANEYFSEKTASAGLVLVPVTGSGAESAVENGEISLYLSPSAEVPEENGNIRTVTVPSGIYTSLTVNAASYKQLAVRKALMCAFLLSFDGETKSGMPQLCAPAFRGFGERSADIYGVEESGDAVPPESEEPEEEYYPDPGYGEEEYYPEPGYGEGEIPEDILPEEKKETVLSLLLSGGYSLRNGVLIDPVTGTKSVFTVYVSSEKEKSLFENAVPVFEKIGAELSVVTDENTEISALTGDGLPVYTFTWDASSSPALYSKYAFSSKSDNVAACGIKKLYTTGQLSNFGTVLITGDDGTEKEINQSDAVSELDRLLTLYENAFPGEEKQEYGKKALNLLSELYIEMPLYEKYSTYIANPASAAALEGTELSPVYPLTRVLYRIPA